VLRALAKQPDRRFTDATEFAQSMRAALPVYRPSTARIRRSRDIASADSPTRNCGEPIPGPSQPAPSIDNLRRAIGDSLVRGKRKQIAAGYLLLAKELGRKRHFAAAASELQEGIDLLSAGGADDDCLDELGIALEQLRREAPGRRPRSFA
jgi:hypothetical protein